MYNLRTTRYATREIIGLNVAAREISYSQR